MHFQNAVYFQYNFIFTDSKFYLLKFSVVNFLTIKFNNLIIPTCATSSTVEKVCKSV